MIHLFCRDCAIDPTCVMCMDCFQASVHKSHRYKVGMGRNNSDLFRLVYCNFIPCKSQVSSVHPFLELMCLYVLILSLANAKCTCHDTTRYIDIAFIFILKCILSAVECLYT